MLKPKEIAYKQQQQNKSPTQPSLGNFFGDGRTYFSMTRLQIRQREYQEIPLNNKNCK